MATKATKLPELNLGGGEDGTREVWYVWVEEFYGSYLVATRGNYEPEHSIGLAATVGVRLPLLWYGSKEDRDESIRASVLEHAAKHGITA